MKVLMVFCILISICSYAIGRPAGEKTEVVIRPVTLYVFDAETKEALKGVKVYVTNVTCYPKPYLPFGALIGAVRETNTYYLYEFETDENGEVKIPEYTYRVKETEYLYKQRISINLDVFDKTADTKTIALKLEDIVLFRGESKYIYMPMAEYKAVYLINYPFPLTEREERLQQSEASNPYYTKIRKGHEFPVLNEKERRKGPKSFYCGPEEFTIYLEKQTGVSNK